METFPRSDERSRMVEQQIRARGITNARVLDAMREIPRHLFVPAPHTSSAYIDAPLPIGNGQTISQPYIVALMTDLLEPQPEDRVLEIGAGSGYQAAILARLVNHVTTIERIHAVADLAKKNLASLGLKNVSIIVGDGTQGYRENAPFNRIIITASTPQIPPPLINQLDEEGILVAPVGGRDIQELIILKKHHGRTVQSSHGGVRFVPLIGEYGWTDT
ncbi:MAG: protein-L-isoaspartate(D-aspartate) O-methyltransferase [Methanoregula sp.]|nr:protein-L-isoaspartate(D-aspartate) O-methyltransferase [Methanoregula sp.]MDD5142282.1 protein-L-isoaspartate(D-aspartate) O-methyltransferase [Methanoregula sp.]